MSLRNHNGGFSVGEKTVSKLFRDVERQYAAVLAEPELVGATNSEAQPSTDASDSEVMESTVADSNSASATSTSESKQGNRRSILKDRDIRVATMITLIQHGSISLAHIATLIQHMRSTILATRTTITGEDLDSKVLNPWVRSGSESSRGMVSDEGNIILSLARFLLLLSSSSVFY